MINVNDAAYPSPYGTENKGFTKRERIAIEIASALLISKGAFTPEVVAAKAIMYTDELIKALDKKEKAPAEPYDNLH